MLCKCQQIFQDIEWEESVGDKRKRLSKGAFAFVFIPLVIVIVFCFEGCTSKTMYVERKPVLVSKKDTASQK